MDLIKVSNDLKNQTDYRLEQRFLEMMRSNPNYRNLSTDNRETILDLLKKYKDKKRHGMKVSELSVRRDMYRLYQSRIKLGLTKRDLDQIKDLLAGLKDS